MYFLKILFIYRERGREGEREGEKHQYVWLPLMHPPLGTWSVTQACALTGNRTRDPLVHRLALNPLSHTSQGLSKFLICFRGEKSTFGVTHVWGS